MMYESGIPSDNMSVGQVDVTNIVDNSSLFLANISPTYQQANFDLGFWTDNESDEEQLLLQALEEATENPFEISTDKPISEENETSLHNLANSDLAQVNEIPDEINILINNISPGNQIFPSCNNRKPTFVEVKEPQIDYVNKMKNRNTLKKTESVMNVFSKWLQSEPRHEMRNIDIIPPTELNNLVGEFLLSIRKYDGSEYEPDTLTSYHRGIDRWLREKNYMSSLAFGPEFRSSRDVLASKRKELKQKGKGNRPNKSTPLTEREQNILENKGIIGNHSPEALQNKIWLNNTMQFGLRGRDENRKLKWGDVKLQKDERGVEFLSFNERDTKTRSGEQSSGHHRAFNPKQFALQNKHECPVETYKQFKLHRPHEMCQEESPFYLAINHKRKQNSQRWYKCQPLGKNYLNAMMKRMAERGNLENRKTNHSARSTTATRLLHAGVAPTTIAQLTGHKNVSSLNNYAVASIEQQESMSNIISLQKPAAEGITPQPHKHPPLVPQFPTTQSPSAPQTNHHESSLTRETLNYVQRYHSANQITAGIFQGATFNNCTLNINICPPTETKAENTETFINNEI